ncbi:hypothetical protein CR513_46349, partial [Mucuna pruriens]
MGRVVYVLVGLALLTIIKYAMLFLSDMAESVDFPNRSLLGPLGRESYLGSRFFVELPIELDEFKTSLPTLVHQAIKVELQLKRHDRKSYPSTSYNWKKWGVKVLNKILPLVKLNLQMIKLIIRGISSW